MEAFAVKSFPSLLIIVLMTSSAVTEKLSVESENGKRKILRCKMQAPFVDRTC